MTPRYGIDTSILVRLATSDPEDGFENCVRKLVALVEHDDAEVFASNQVIGEAYIALQHHYGVSKPDARAALASVLSSGLVKPLNGPGVFAALQATSGCGLLDRLIVDDYHLFIASAGAGGLGCASCHVPPTFALAANSLNIGLDAVETTVFKSPSLKNLGTAAAFMHDGRFSTLDQVVEFYNSGIQPSPLLDPRLKGPGNVPLVLNLSAADKAVLVAFLKTLDDPVLAADSKFSSPFLQ